MCPGHAEGDGYRSAADQTSGTPLHLLDLPVCLLIACPGGYCAYLGVCPAGSRAAAGRPSPVIIECLRLCDMASSQGAGEHR
jgi:hypothetical protein